MKFLFFSAILLGAACCLDGLDAEFKGFRELPPSSRTENLVKNPSFLDGDRHWVVRAGNGYEVGPFGPNNVPALRQKFVPGEKYNGLVVYQKIKLKPRTTYRYGCLQKTENLARVKNGKREERRPVIGIDWYNSRRQWVNSFDKPREAIDAKGVWKKVEYEFTTPPNSDYTYQLLVYANAAEGEAAWTNFYLEEAHARCVFFLVYPRFGALAPDHSTIEIGTFLEGDFKYGKEKTPQFYCGVKVVSENGRTVRTLVSEIKNERVRFDLKGVEKGRYELQLTFADIANSCILSRGKLPLEISDSGKRILDERGRMFVDGKPFLPIAIYTWGIKEDQTREIKSLGFNSFVPYGALTSNPLRRPFAGIRSFRDSLDICLKNDIYVMPDIRVLDMPETWEKISRKNYYGILEKLFREFRNHPAVIAWYISDEPAPAAIPELEKLRDFVNRHDPGHPTWIVFNNPAELSKYASSTDIAAVDPYPLGAGKKRDTWEQYNVLDQTSTLQKLLGNMDGEGALWMVPQAFSWKIYQDTRRKVLKDNTPEVYDDMPNGREILSMCLTGAIHGAKGFCFYEYQFWNAPGLFQKFGPELKYATGILAANADLILGTRNSPRVAVKNLKGTVLAKAFLSEEGKTGIFVTALGPGESRAEITLEDTSLNLVSRTGNSRKISPGVWLFTGNGIDCDIIRN